MCVCGGGGGGGEGGTFLHWFNLYIFDLLHQKWCMI